jgi:hypothetical protein
MALVRLLNQKYAVIRRQLQSNEYTTDIIDITTFSTPNGKRTILAWMQDMRYYISPDNLYTCPEATMGKGYFNGRLHFSLVNTANRKLINTISIAQENMYARDDSVYQQSDEFLDYPFAIGNPNKRSALGDLVYFATGGTDSTDGAADVLHLIDFNNSGKKHQFGLFIQIGCASKFCTLIGYSDQDDELKWYKWHMTVKWTDENGKDATDTATRHWVDRAVEIGFGKKQTLSFAMDYRARGGAFSRYHFNYNPLNDTYYGLEDDRIHPSDSATPQTWMPEPMKISK